jgi:hypothetical protein
MKRHRPIPLLLGVAAAIVLTASQQPARGQFMPPRDLVDRVKKVIRKAEGRDPAKPTPSKKPAPKVSEADKKKAEAHRQQAMQWYAKTRGSIVSTMHLVQTDHFLIFSSWSRSNDKALKDICEKLYDAMCKQFNLPKTENIWAGRCPIYIFWEEKHYQQFTTRVDGRNQTEAGGYTAQKGDFTYIVMNRCATRTRFYEILVHEGTHAFLGRYRSNKFVARWLNEGLAEYMAATLVPESSAATKYVKATRTAVEEDRDISSIFKTVEINTFDYGIAQSLVRFLIARDRAAFKQLIQLIKAGKNEASALATAYKLTRDDLVTQWRAAAAKKLEKTPAAQ